MRKRKPIDFGLSGKKRIDHRHTRRSFTVMALARIKRSTRNFWRELPHGTISFSLYGTEPFYAESMIQNAMLAPHVFPGWDVRVYYGPEVDGGVIARLGMLGCRTIRCQHDLTGRTRSSRFGIPMQCHLNRAKTRHGMIWRMLALEDPAAGYVLIRDVDGRLSLRDRAVVHGWVASGRNACLNQDVMTERVPIGGAAWGVIGGTVKIRPYLRHVRAGFWGADEYWLAKYIYPQIRESIIRFGKNRGVPIPKHPGFPNSRYCWHRIWMGNNGVYVNKGSTLRPVDLPLEGWIGESPAGLIFDVPNHPLPEQQSWKTRRGTKR